MNNQIAILLGAAIVIGLGVDWLFFDWAGTIFLARKLIDLIEWMQFWR